MNRRGWSVVTVAGFLLLAGLFGASLVTGAAQEGGGASPEDEAKAVEIALAEYPGAEVVATESEQEGGSLLWEVELSSGVEVEIDLSTGEIVETEQDSPNEADDGDAGESEHDDDLFDD